MILKEFDVRSTKENKEDSYIFSLQTRCTTAMYERYFPRYKTTDGWKVLVECVRAVEREKYIVALGVYIIQIEYLIKEFFKLNDEQKKQQSLHLLTNGIDKLLSQIEWDPKPFKEAYEAVISHDYANHWTWKKPKLSPSHKLKAEVLVEHEVTSCDISIIVRNRKGEEIKRQKILSEKPDEIIFMNRLGRLEWESEEIVSLIGRTPSCQLIDSSSIDTNYRWSVNLKE